jgi:hypothetical protein
MIRRVANYFSNIPPMFIDGSIYVILAVFGFLQTQFGSDEASKFISAELLFYLKNLVGSVSAGLLALKLFRSTSYADHKRDKENTDIEPSPVTH